MQLLTLEQVSLAQQLVELGKVLRVNYIWSRLLMVCKG